VLSFFIMRTSSDPRQCSGPLADAIPETVCLHPKVTAQLPAGAATLLGPVEELI
jgi:hypothetical protein